MKIVVYVAIVAWYNYNQRMHLSQCKGVIILKNVEIRNIVRKNRLFFWEVAEAAGISEVTLTRWLRTELNDERRERVMQAINTLLEQGAQK